jgi:beta-lactamase regulating signal transducer with metallopeptidase domain
MSGTWSPFAGWLLHSAVGGGLLLLLAWPLTRLCRQPARRQRLGESALLAALLLCVLNLGPSWITLPLFCSESSCPPASAAQTVSSYLPSAFVAGPDRPGLPPFEDALAGLGTSAADANFAGVDRTVEDASQQTPAPESHGRESGTGITHPLASLDLSRWLTLLIAAYAATSAVLLGRWLLGHFFLWRLLRSARPASEAMNHIFETMAPRQGRRPRLLVSRRLSVPLSCGLIRPCVVVPASFCDPNAVRMLRWVFAHELAHTVRGDAWACLLFGLGQALYFCFPWFWWLRRQVRLCQEYVADAAAAEQTADPEDYAQFLVRLTQAPAVPLGALGVFGNTSDLLRRVTMLLQNPIRVEKHCPRWWSLATAGGLLGLALLVSGIGLRADAATAQDERQTVTAVGGVDAVEKPSADENNGPPAEKKKVKKEPAVEKVLRDLEELLRDLPSALDGDQVKQLYEQLKKLKLDALKEDLRELQSLDLPPNQALNQIRQFAEVDLSKLSETLGQDAGQHQNEGRLGVQVQKPSSVLTDQFDLPKGQGLVIERVLPQSAAAKAGLKAHDILLEFNSKPVPNEVADFVKMLGELKANTPVDAVVLRKGKKQTIKGLSLSEAKTQPFQLRVLPRVQPLPQLPAGPLVPFNLQRPNIQMHGFSNRAVITTLFRTKDGFNTRYQEGSLVIIVTGSVTDGKSKVKQIQIQDGGKNETYDSLDKVPETYRDKVKNLIEMSEKNNLKIEIGADFEILKLRNAGAGEAAKILDEMFNDTKTNAIRIRVVVDPSSNSLLVKANPLDMLTIRSIVDRFIDHQEVNAKPVIKTWKVGPLQRAKAKDVYYRIKDIYREHLPKNVSPTQNGASQDPRARAMELDLKKQMLANFQNTFVRTETDLSDSERRLKLLVAKAKNPPLPALSESALEEALKHDPALGSSFSELLMQAQRLQLDIESATRGYRDPNHPRILDRRKKLAATQKELDSLREKARPRVEQQLLQTVQDDLNRDISGLRANIAFLEGKREDLNRQRERLRLEIQDMMNEELHRVDLTVTYDEQTNTVTVRCAEPIYQEIAKLVEDYENDAKDPRRPRR